MTFNRHYLTAMEIAYITNAMVYGIIKEDENGDLIKDENGKYVYEILPPVTEFERQLFKYTTIARILIKEFEGESLSSVEIYDTLMENSIDLDKEVDNLSFVDTIVDKELGVSKTVERTLDNLIYQIDEKMKNFDLKSVITELNTLQNFELKPKTTRKRKKTDVVKKD